MGGYHQLPMQHSFYGQFPQQQFGQYQPYPQMYQQQMSMLHQQHPYQHMSMSQQQLQHQLQQQMQQQTQQLALSRDMSGGSSLSGRERDVQRTASAGSQRGSPKAPQPAAVASQVLAGQQSTAPIAETKSQPAAAPVKAQSQAAAAQ